MALPTNKQLRAQGKALRKRTPRASHAGWKPWPGRPDPVALIKEQNRARVPELVRIRYARMLQSPFAFLRGSAVVMATDLSKTSLTGINVHAGGDCHLMNFGAYGTPERNFVFDINDFDETAVAPWEWDLKRLVASIAVAGRHNQYAEKRLEQAVLACVQRYREHTDHLAKLGGLEAWYSVIEAQPAFRSMGAGAEEVQRYGREGAKARRHLPETMFGKLTRKFHGARRFIDNPPLIFHTPRARATSRLMHSVLEEYRSTLRDDLRVLLNRYELVDVATKVVGVGSVGTRCDVLLLMDQRNDCLVLQAKEAMRSVLEPFAGKSPYKNHGERVVTGQRVMQAASDLFLGWTSYLGHDYYVRQLRDMKASVDLTALDAAEFVDYACLCASALARAHARSGKAAIISGYLGTSARFDRALVKFAADYADQTERDYDALKAAARRGIIKQSSM